MTSNGKGIAVERKLWSGLRKLAPDVRRQQVIGERVVDFYIPSAALAVEVSCDHDRRRPGPRIDRATAERAGVELLVFTPRDVLRRDGRAWWTLRRALGVDGDGLQAWSGRAGPPVAAHETFASGS